MTNKLKLHCTARFTGYRFNALTAHAIFKLFAFFFSFLWEFSDFFASNLIIIIIIYNQFSKYIIYLFLLLLLKYIGIDNN